MEIAAVDGVGSGGIGRKIENLSTIAKLDKSKKLNLAKSKKSTLPKDFAKVNFTKTDFLTSKAKQAFLQLRKVFTEASILRYFDLKHYIYIKTDFLGYVIGRIPSQMTLDQHSSDHITHKDLYPNPKLSKSEINQ